MRRRYHPRPERMFNAETGKHNLNAAFTAMRKLGLIARQSFSCCGSCAGYELATMVKEMPEVERIKVKGVVFYHKQDAARLRESGETYLGYGQVGVHDVGTFGEPTVWIGEQVVKILRECGLETEWDGKEETRILVRYPGKKGCECTMDGRHGHYSRCQQESEAEYEGVTWNREQTEHVRLQLCGACAASLLASGQVSVVSAEAK